MFATEAEAHAEWHRNSGQEFGCPWDACHPPEPERCPWCGDYEPDEDHPCSQAYAAGYARAQAERAERDAEALAEVLGEAQDVWDPPF